MRRHLMNGLALILAAFFVLVSVPVMAESYDLMMGPFETKFETVQALDTRTEPPVAFEKFTGYPVTLWPKDESSKGMISLKIQEYYSEIDVSDSALRDAIKEEASVVFSAYPITYQPTTIDGRPAEVGTIKTENGDMVIFAAYSPDGIGISGKVLALVYGSPFEGAPTENGDMLLNTLKIQRG
jgi:hypothetical protein